MILARCWGLTAVVHLAAVLTLKAHALRARLRELYQPATAQRGRARSTFDHTLCFGPLIRWAAGTHPDKRLVLALDPTLLTDRFCVLCAAVLYRGCGLPVAWAVRAAHEKGSWNAVWFDLLVRLREALGDGWTVLVLTDRGWSRRLVPRNRPARVAPADAGYGGEAGPAQVPPIRGPLS